MLHKSRCVITAHRNTLFDANVQSNGIRNRGMIIVTNREELNDH
jgi:hypothetical protein